MERSTYKAVIDILNYYTQAISYVTACSDVRIFLKNDGAIEYIYDDKTNKCIEWLTDLCKKKIKEIINESTIEGRFIARRITSDEF